MSVSSTDVRGAEGCMAELCVRYLTCLPEDHDDDDHNDDEEGDDEDVEYQG